MSESRAATRSLPSTVAAITSTSGATETEPRRSSSSCSSRTRSSGSHPDWTFVSVTATTAVPTVVRTIMATPTTTANTVMATETAVTTTPTASTTRSSFPIRSWLRGVEIIRDRLIEIDPDRESVYTSNAADYLEQLEALDDRYREALSDREHDHVLLAGHDSFQYLGERYGFEIHTPMGLSPDDEPSGTEIAAAVEFAEEHGLEYVLWDYFDGPELAETIAAEVDTVVGTEMVSPAESVVEAWDEGTAATSVRWWRSTSRPSAERSVPDSRCDDRSRWSFGRCSERSQVRSSSFSSRSRSA
ncbi:zinc ABC transporter substrate-binding protein [Natrialba swarupiae]|nr:zinc ABC transporter substrate-binding protein [Natrialba swarupiae]